MVVMAVALGLGLLAPLGCNRRKQSASPGPQKPTVTVVTPKDGGTTTDVDEEDRLLAERGDLTLNRKRLTERREEILRERQAAADPVVIERLQNEEKKLLGEEQDLNRRERELMQKLEEVARREAQRRGTDDPSASLARREAQLARREAELARREAELTRREREHLAARAKALDECRAMPVTTVTRVEMPRGGGTYGKRDVEPVMRLVHAEMRRRGILESDLPGAGRLFGEVSRAGQSGDYTRAKFAAEQLLELVKTIRIDRGFIGAKIERLSAQMRGRSLPGPTKSEVDRLFRKATAHYGDGQFVASNGELNRIYALLR